MAETNLKISFHSVSCVPNKLLCQKQAVPGFPLIRLFKPGELNGVDMKHTEVSPITVLKKLGINTDGMVIEEEVEDLEIPTLKQPEKSWWKTMLYGADSEQHQQNTLYMRTRDDLKSDIHMSFDFTMRNSVLHASG